MAFGCYNGETVILSLLIFYFIFFFYLFSFEILLSLTSPLLSVSRVTMSIMTTFNCYDCAVLLSERLSPTLTCWELKYRKGLRLSLA